MNVKSIVRILKSLPEEERKVLLDGWQPIEVERFLKYELLPEKISHRSEREELLEAYQGVLHGGSYSDAFLTLMPKLTAEVARDD